MILVDTSAFYALADASDPNHDQAQRIFARILRLGPPLTHNYILLETAALIQRRLGLSVALRLCRDAERFKILWVDQPAHASAVELLERIGRRGVSLVDCVSFVLMRREKLDTAFAFDPDFGAQGFRLAGE